MLDTWLIIVYSHIVDKPTHREIERDGGGREKEREEARSEREREGEMEWEGEVDIHREYDMTSLFLYKNIDFIL